MSESAFIIKMPQEADHATAEHQKKILLSYQFAFAYSN